jgi:hypothetical protein
MFDRGPESRRICDHQRALVATAEVVVLQLLEHTSQMLARRDGRVGKFLVRSQEPETQRADFRRRALSRQEVHL